MSSTGQQISESLGPRSRTMMQASQQRETGNERTPLLNSIGAAAESLVNNSVVVGSMQQGVSWRMAAFLLVNTALGAGMLNYPYAYNQIGGVWAAALMQVILLVFISSTMFILVYCADFNQDDTYHDVLLSMCGKRAQQISALSILLTCYGINITFLVIIGDQYDRIFHSLLADQLEEFWFLDRKFTIFVTAVLFIWPMCYAQRLDFLRYASVLGMFAMLYVAFLTVYEHFVLDEATITAARLGHLVPSNQTTTTTTAATTTTTTTPAANTSFRWWFEPLAIVPVLCFAYQTHEVIVPVYACMRERYIASFMKASVFGLVILFFLYNLVGAFGYLTFGEHVGADIMSLYDGKDPIVVVGIVALVVKMITTYPPLMFCGRSALDGLYAEVRQLTPGEFKRNEKGRRVVISTLWFMTTVVLAVFAPDISVTLQLLGSMASINVFVFPGMCLLSLTHRLRRARHALLMGELPADCQQTNGYCSQQRAKDYHLISGSYFGATMRRRQLMQQQHLQHSLRSQLMSSGNHHGHNHQANQQCNGLAPTTALVNGHSCPNSNNKHFTATFASLIELENNLTKSTCSQDDERARRERNSFGLNGKAPPACAEVELWASDKKPAPALVNSQHQQQHQCLQSVNNYADQSITNSLLNKFGSSIAPSTVAQIGISRCAAMGLYSFAGLLIAFGAFIFVLELVNVFGLLE